MMACAFSWKRMGDGPERWFALPDDQKRRLDDDLTFIAYSLVTFAAIQRHATSSDTFLGLHQRCGPSC
jgi:hypothetical protein